MPLLRSETLYSVRWFEMSESSVVEFEKNLRMSGAISESQLAKIDFAEFSDPRYTAKRLVDQQLLTEWQAKLVLSGRNQMKVGGYLLLDRVERNELGDRYQAKHQSLDRLVELQFLPKEFNRHSPQFEPFINSARMMTEIDHPNLAHVYDIGEEGGRYYVVQEFVNGDPLAAFDFASMLPTDVIRLIKEMASVVRFLHERKILHGSINKDTVFINRGGQCQLNGLITKILQERVLGRVDEIAAKREELQFGLIDRIAMQGLAGELLEKALGRNADPELLSNIVQLGSKPESLAKIESLACHWLDKHQEEIADQRESRRSEALKATPTTQKANLPRPTQQTTAKTVSRANPQIWKVLVPIIVALIGLTGVIVWGFTSGTFFGTNRSVADKSKSKENGAARADFVAKTDTSNSATDQPKANSKFSKKKSTKQPAGSELAATPVIPGDEVDAAKTAISLSNTNANAVKPETSTDSAATIPADESTKQSSNDKSATLNDDSFASKLLSTAAAPAGSDDGQKSPPPRDAAPPQKGKTKSSEKSTSSKSDPFDVPGVAKKSSDSNAQKGEASTSDSATANSSNSSNPSGVPMAATGINDMPTQFELPPIDGAATPVALAPLNLPEGAEMIVDLIYDPEKCGKGKNYFTISPAKNKPEWNVLHSSKAADPEAKLIAKFLLDEQQLKFAWEKDVEPRSNANFMINSSLNLTTEKENKIIALRKPVTIDSLALNEKTFTFKDNLEIPWLPTGGLKVEFGTLDPAHFGEGRIDNPQMANKAPATISFTELVTERVFWIAISADFKNKADVRIEVQTKNDRGTIVLSPKSLSEVMDGLQALNAQLVLENNLAQEILGKTPAGERGIGQKRDNAKAAEKKVKDAQVFRGKALEQAELVRGLVNVPIPTRIVYEFQNQKIELARTSNFSTEPLPDPDEKKKR